MLMIAIDRADQLPKGHAALGGDLVQTVPELVFKAVQWFTSPSYPLRLNV